MGSGPTSDRKKSSSGRAPKVGRSTSSWPWTIHLDLRTERPALRQGASRGCLHPESLMAEACEIHREDGRTGGPRVFVVRAAMRRTETAQSPFTGRRLEPQNFSASRTSRPPLLPVNQGLGPDWLNAKDPLTDHPKDVGLPRSLAQEQRYETTATHASRRMPRSLLMNIWRTPLPSSG